MNELCIAMIAAPRQAMTVDQTLASLRSGGFHETVHLFAEPGTTVGDCPNTVVWVHRQRKGALHNWLHAIRWALTKTTAPYLLIVEDDVAYCRGARAALDRRLREGPAFGFLNLLTPVQVGVELSCFGTGWIPTQKTNIWGTQAVCFSRHLAFGLLEHFRRNHDDPRSISYDLMTLQYYARFPEAPCCYHIPSLCEHVGWRETTIPKPFGLACPEHRLPLRRGYGFDPDYWPPDTYPAQPAETTPQ